MAPAERKCETCEKELIDREKFCLIVQQVTPQPAPKGYFFCSWLCLKMYLDNGD